MLKTFAAPAALAGLAVATPVMAADPTPAAPYALTISGVFNNGTDTTGPYYPEIKSYFGFGYINDTFDITAQYDANGVKGANGFAVSDLSITINGKKTVKLADDARIGITTLGIQFINLRGSTYLDSSPSLPGLEYTDLILSLQLPAGSLSETALPTTDFLKLATAVNIQFDSYGPMSATPIYSRATVSGYATSYSVGGIGSVIRTSALTPLSSSVPEPASWAMLIFGMGAVGYTLRRRKAVVQLAA